MTPIEAARALAEAASRAGGGLDEIKPLAQAVFDQLRDAPQGAADGVIAVLAPAVRRAPGEGAALLALTCGAMIERGADPAPLAGPLRDRLRAAAPAVRRLHEACAAELPPPAQPDSPPEAVSANTSEADEQFEQALARFRPVMPAEAEAWDEIERLFPPTIAVMSASPDARRDGQDLLDDLGAISDFHSGANWISRMLKVLHEEPYLALEPSTRRGIAGRMSGLADNFQLNVLLMDVFPRGLLSGRRVSARAAAVARGDGPAEGGELITGRWNLYAWTALSDDGALPEPGLAAMGHWIWNEGTPADIPVFDGRRVILLGPPSYVRTWDSQRLFNNLKAELTADEKLSPAQVAQSAR